MEVLIFGHLYKQTFLLDIIVSTSIFHVIIFLLETFLDFRNFVSI